MQADAPAPIKLSDYTPPKFKINETRLEFTLHPAKTRVISELDISSEGANDLVLDGVGLRLISISIDGEELAFGQISIDDKSLTISRSCLPDTPFTLRTEVEINPQGNTTLEGLYLSNGMYCTQCEAEGFRHITYYLDRPDVLTTFRVKINSDLPVRLSNGNPTDQGNGWSEWHDPHPKPSYLFALVAGELEVIEDKFTTASGREVDLQIFVRKGDETRCDYAMDALKRSMKWDEVAYGREYDLDLFMIVAVDDFNMGAMENKGLNIFNSRLVLASPETATDADYAAIETVIAHEYFHNWTGNRITCRDWFQLSLKEGLTVYRDQEFTKHERSPAVKRIEDVKRLRGHQFPEDAGPLSHPVRPTEYVEINNFYTPTIYEKGAELIGMMNTLVGAEDYRRATDLYFDRHDGGALTIEHWLGVFADTTGRDLSQFKLWYSQAGTPSVHVETTHADGKIIINLRQELRAKQEALLIPLRFTIFGPNGDIAHQGLIEMTRMESSHSFDAPDGAVLSINQGFSAPVTIRQTPYDAAFLATHDNDPFNRWEAVRQMALDVLAHGADPAPLIDAMGTIIEDHSLDADYRALLLGLPEFSDVVAAMKADDTIPDPDVITARRKSLAHAIGMAHSGKFERVYHALRVSETGDLSAVAAGQRSLSLACLRYLSAIDPACAIAKTHFAKSTLMTDRLGALSILVAHGVGNDELEVFYERFEHERLVVDKWLSVQALNTPPEQALAKVRALSQHPCFDNPNPNRFRSLMGGFAAGNLPAFHAADGSGYAYYADQIIDYDGKNPQTAARMSTAFQAFRDFGAEREALARAQLSRIKAHDGLSENLGEMITRMLG